MGNCTGEQKTEERQNKGCCMETFAEINKVINDFVWVKTGVFLLLGAGIWLTVYNRFFQIRHVKTWWKNTIGSIFSKNNKVKKNTEEGSVSQFQALCTALAAAIGTGNIAGVASAIVIGGPGAVFWMWTAAIFGMMTKFSENVLGIYYRRRNEEGEWSGGAMYYLRDGLGKLKIPGIGVISKVLAILFACFAVLASFGIGNLGQVNKIVLNLQSAFFSQKTLDNIGYAFGGVSWVAVIIGALLLVVGAVIILGGIQRIASVAEKVVPFMACTYVLGALVLVFINGDMIGDAILSIFRHAFGVKAAAGGAAGIAIGKVISVGCQRGVFSNEAGLGSSVMVHSNSNVVEPVRQGMWGVFEVFVDTLIVCTMTALVVLTSGYINLDTGMAAEGVNDATLVAKAFGNIFGQGGEIFVAIAILLFAFTTVLGWSHYGTKSMEYLAGVKVAKVYKVVFVILIMGGAVMTSSLAWDVSDTFNGLMMIPNLIGVLILSPLVIKITKNYMARTRKGEKIEPMLSAFPEVQKEQSAKLD